MYEILGATLKIIKYCCTIYAITCWCASWRSEELLCGEGESDDDECSRTDQDRRECLEQVSELTAVGKVLSELTTLMVMRVAPQHVAPPRPHIWLNSPDSPRTKPCFGGLQNSSLCHRRHRHHMQLFSCKASMRTPTTYVFLAYCCTATFLLMTRKRPHRVPIHSTL